MSVPQLAAMYRRRGVQAYEQLGIDYALCPEVLLYAAGSPIGGQRVTRYLRQYESVVDKPTLSVATASGAKL